MPSALFDGADLSGVDFGFADLTGSDFRKALSIKGTNFVNGNLSQARFAGLNLAGYDFTGASLDGADFTGADLTGAIFADSADRPASLLNTDLSVAKSVKGARFRCELNRTRLDGMDLSGIDFTGSRLTGTSLRRTNLRVAVLDSPPLWSQDHSAPTDLTSATINFAQTRDAAKHGNWSGTNLTGRSMPDLPADLSSLKAINAVLPKWDFFKVNLQSANLSGADLRNCNFSYANLTLAVLKGAQCQGGGGYRAAIFEGAMMQNADLSGANLTGASLSGVYLYGGQAKLTQATLVQTSFATAYLPGMLFADDSGVACQGADFTGACLVNAKFNGTDLSAYDDLQPPHPGRRRPHGDRRRHDLPRRRVGPPPGQEAHRARRAHLLAGRRDPTVTGSLHTGFSAAGLLTQDPRELWTHANSGRTRTLMKAQSRQFCLVAFPGYGTRGTRCAVVTRRSQC